MHTGGGKCCLLLCVFLHQQLCRAPWEHLLGLLGAFNVPSWQVGAGPPQPLWHTGCFVPGGKDTGCLWLEHGVAVEQPPLLGSRALAAWRRAQLPVPCAGDTALCQPVSPSGWGIRWRTGTAALTLSASSCQSLFGKLFAGHSLEQTRDWYKLRWGQPRLGWH